MKNRLSSLEEEQSMFIDTYEHYSVMIFENFNINLPENKEAFTVEIYMEKLGPIILEENGSPRGKSVGQGKIFINTKEEIQENIIVDIGPIGDEQLQDTVNSFIFIEQEEYKSIQLFIKKLRKNGENIQYDFPHIAGILEKYMSEEQKELLQQYYHKENLSLQKIMMGLQGPKVKEQAIYQYIHNFQAKK